MTDRTSGWVRRLVVLAAVVLLAACGGDEGSERPADCQEDEYYDEGTERCISCPAVVEPECPPGCEVVVVQDQRECPALECEQDCSDDGGD